MNDGPISECQYIGSEQKEWPYTFCGQKSVEGRSYCAEHYHQMYQKGSANKGSRKMEKLVEKELAELKLQQEIAEIEDA